MLKLRRLREERGMSQNDLAKILEVNQAAVSRWESGETRPVSKYRRKLEALYGCTVDDLLAPDENRDSA